jgi:glycosyltransferase involved in cell wall biosynthesis
MERKRLVSVVVPTRDRPQLLRKALASIRALEGEDLAFEILVGDNGSAPETQSIVAEFQGKYLPAPRHGPAAARNAGLREATGEFIAFLDDDDEWLHGHIRPHIDILDANPDVAAVFGQIVYVTDDLTPVSAPWPASWPEDDQLVVTMLSGYYPQIGATVVRASLLQSIGLMDETLIGDEDWDWQLRFAESHRIGFVDKPCIYSRTRPAGSYDDIQIERIKYCAKVFWRHAGRNLRRWRSPLTLVRAYIGATAHFYTYFVEAAIARAETGDYSGARRAAFHAFRLNPKRALKMMKGAPFRSAVASAFFGGNLQSAYIFRR